MFIEHRTCIEIIAVIIDFLPEAQVRVTAKRQKSTTRQARVAVVHSPKGHCLTAVFTVTVTTDTQKLRKFKAALGQVVHHSGKIMLQIFQALNPVQWVDKLHIGCIKRFQSG